MGSFARERGGISWRDQTLESISAPPVHLLTFFGLLVLLMTYSIQSDYEEKIHRTRVGFRLFLIILLPILVLLISHLTVRWSEIRDVSTPVYESVRGEGSSPWGVALVLLLVLLMLNYKSSFQSAWFRL